MTAVTKFDKPTCRTLGAEAQQELAAFAARHGLTVTYAGGALDETSFTMKLKLSVNDPGAVAAKQRKDFDQLCALYDLTPAHYRAVFLARGTAYRLVGFETGRVKYPLRAERVEDGKVMLFTEAVKGALKVAA